MPNKPRCEAIQRVDHWPYVQACKEDADYEILNHTIRDKVDARLICLIHAEDLQAGFPGVALGHVKPTGN